VKKAVLVMIALSLAVLPLGGCAGKSSELQMEDTTVVPPATRTIVFPNGTVFGGASRQQATKLAQIFVESHNMAMKQRAEFQRAMERTEEASRRLTEAYDKNMATARMAYGMLRKIAEQQGIGEITIFFPVNISKIPKSSLEYERLVRFADYLARESHGRKVIITSVGSASAFGLEKVNERLAEERAQAPVDIIDHFLVKIPHEFYKIYGTGEMYSPRNVNMKVHKRYQHVHLVALYEEKDKEGASYESALLPRDRSEAEEPRAEMVKTPPGVSNRTDQLAAERRASVIAGQETGASVQRGVFRNFLGMGFVYIPGGTFIMGSPLGEYGRDDNERQHQVTLTRGFYMQTTEVTQGQWKALMGNNPSHFLNCGWDCPVEQVNWYEVQEFIKKLNEAEKTRRYRLPTEAEWEYASRAGSTTAFHNGEIAGDTSGYDEVLDQVGWYYRNSEKGTHQVSQKNSNAWGLYDMHGNVWEWCQDWQRKYPFRAVTDPTGATTGKARIRRGGSWSHYPLFCRSAYRSWYEPKDATPHLGFRLVRDAVEPRVDCPEDLKPELAAVRRPVVQPSVRAEECITISGVTFDLDSSQIREDMVPVLERAAEILKGRTENIILEGHACTIASMEYNQALSERRVAAVKNFLVRKGISGSRMKIIASGETKPKYDNSTEAGRSLNRRVEIHLQK